MLRGRRQGNVARLFQKEKGHQGHHARDGDGGDPVGNPPAELVDKVLGQRDTDQNAYADPGGNDASGKPSSLPEPVVDDCRVGHPSRPRQAGCGNDSEKQIELPLRLYQSGQKEPNKSKKRPKENHRPRADPVHHSSDSRTDQVVEDGKN